MNKFNKFNLDCKKKNNFLPKYNYLKKIFEHDIRLCNTGNEKFADQNFQKSIKRIFLLLNDPNLSRSVNASSKAWVGCS